MRKQLTAMGVLAMAVILSGLRISEADAAKVTLTYMPSHAGNFPLSLKAEKSIVDEWNKKNPSIQVKLVPGVTDWRVNIDKIMTLFAAGKGPDIFGPDSVAYMLHNKWFLNLDPYIKRDKYDIDDFWDQGLAITAFDGKHVGKGSVYGLPYYGLVVIGLFYNKTLFNEAGIGFPDESWNWNRYLEVAKKLTKTDSNKRIIQYGTNYFLDSLTGQGPMLWSHGADYIDEDRTRCTLEDPKAIQALEFMRSLRWVHHVMPGDGSPAAPNISFATGKVAMDPGHGAQVPTLDTQAKGMKWDVAMIPKGPAGRFTRVAAYNIGISAKTRHKEEAWQFFKFLNSREATYIRIAAGGHWALPGRKSMSKDPKYIQSMRPMENVDGFINSVPFGQEGRILNTLGWVDMNTVIQTELNKVWANKVSVAQAVKAIAPQINRLLARNGNK